MKKNIDEVSSIIEKEISSKVEKVFNEYDSYWGDDDFDFSGYGYDIVTMFNELNELKKKEQITLLENLINKYFMSLPKINLETFDKDFRNIDNYIEIFERKYDDMEIIEESDYLVNSIIYKMNFDKGVEITLPINMKYMIQYIFSSRIEKVKIIEIIKKAVLKLIVVNKYYNNKTK